ncbi:synaptonemal complex central element protein 2 [Spea bombifrons]|uniref:synaptonemal complex central element protein 2 n=1 Tax=Spea bombifrons TaxID=233779 RepID=UPI00234BAEC7|nr:synaptonemal complex central element protein 2 [Spea bombifrons]
MSANDFEAPGGPERSCSPSTSKQEGSGASSTQTTPRRPQSPSLFNQTSDLASSCSSSEGKSGNYFTALEATVDALQRRAQSLIDKINEGRSKDQAIMKNFNESLAMKVNELSQCLEDKMYNVYDHHNKQLQDRLQELPEIIERIGQLQDELKQVCQTVATVYKDLCVQPEI